MFGLSTGMLIVIIITIIFGFYMAWTIGANDVANSMGTVFGSGALTLKKAILIAAIFEFMGAFLVGSHVTKTLKSGIVDPNYFSEEGVDGIIYFSGDAGLHVFLAGMLAVLLAASLWVTLATYKSLPISTSQSIVGAVTGFGLISVILGEIPLKAIQGPTLLIISIGWILSPIFGGLMAFMIFRFIRKAIFDVEDTIGRAKNLIPIFIFLVFFIIIFTGISGGLKNLRDTMEVLPISDNIMDLVLNNMLFKLGLAAAIGAIAAIIGKIRLSRSRRKKGEGKYDMVERMFGSLLILTACYVAFAHGANDVANSIGPVAAIWSAARDGTISSTVEIPPVILVLGGAGIVVGISTWGYKVMTTIGKKITRITPTRGFAASFGGATSVLICSFLGIPVSTSQIIVGAVIGVGLAGGITAIDFRVIRNIVTSWVLTIPIAAGTAAALFLLFRGIMLIIL